ncbi:MAG: cytochrome c3 family protein [Thermodesulfobacteriota bacterium]
MPVNKTFLLAGVALFFCGLSTGATSCLAADCLTGGCHDAIRAGAHLHSPVAKGECEVCHDPTGVTNHPSGSGKDFAPVESGADLCFSCHDRQGFDDRYQHGPSVSGACLACHNPHAAEQPVLLRLPLQELCLDCHQDFARRMKGASFLHSAITEQDCGACHLPHSSGSPGLLKGESSSLCFVCHDELKKAYDSSLNKHKALYVGQQCGNCHFAHFSEHSTLLVRPGQELCFGCHGEDSGGRNIRQEIEGKKVVHGPVAEGQCSACHQPHGSSHAKLLNGSFPESFYAPFHPDQYDFCFRCHDKELLTAQPVGAQTAFRNGTDNLHYRHVARKQKGRTCNACHTLHASDGDKLINPDGIPFGDWKIPIRFEASATGGGCVPGCHRPLNYDRQTPIDYTTAEPTAPPKAAEEEKKTIDDKQQDVRTPETDLESLDSGPGKP